MNRVRALLPALFMLFALAARPATAIAPLQPVEPQVLDQFIGWTVYGEARAPLGVVSKVDHKSGVIGLVGRHGEFALMHTSVLARNGMILHAPTVSVGDVARASTANLLRPGSTLIFPHVIVEEPPLG